MMTPSNGRALCRRLLFLALAVGVCALPASALTIVPAGATVSFTVDPAVTFVKGMSSFPNLADTLVVKNQTALAASISASYVAGDIQFNAGNGPGIRWTETVTNNTGVAWNSYTVQLGNNGLYFSDLPTFSPAFVIVSGTNPGQTVTATTTPGTITRSPDKKSITMLFAVPVANGVSFSFHSPIEGLSGAPGQFNISETAAAGVVPEPGSLLLLGTGLGAVSLLARRRKK